MRRGRLMVAAAAAAILALGTIAPTDAVFSGATDNAVNSLETTSLSPPSGLTLSQSCEATVPIEFRAAAQATGESSSLTVAKPSGVTAGDVMLAHLVTSTGTLTAPAGWRVVRLDSFGGYSYVYVKVATASEPPSYEWKSGFSVRWAAGIGAWTGVSTILPVHAHASQGGSGSTITAPSVTATVANTRLVAIFALGTSGGIAPQAGMTERWDIASTGFFINFEAAGADQAFVGPGATGSRSATATNGASNVGQMILLSPRGTTVTAQWTASPSTFASGYKLQRWAGATLEQEHAVTPATTTTYTDGPLPANTAFTYRLSAFYRNWRSSEISASITTGPGC